MGECVDFSDYFLYGVVQSDEELVSLVETDGY